MNLIACVSLLLPQEPKKYTGGPSDRVGAWDQFPPPASTFVDDVDGMIVFVHWVSAFFFVLLTGILVYALFKWRRKTEDQPAASNVTHNTPLEVTWTVIPLVIVMVIFVWGWKSARDMTIAPKDALTYKVTGQQWSWAITHPGDLESDSVDEMYVPKGVACKLVMRSTDVLHSFFIPAFRAKRDVVPGRYQTMWFKPTMLGDFDYFCTEYCGKDHSRMIGWGKVHVVHPEHFAKKPWQVEDPDPKKRGQRWYNNLCASCHSIDGSKSTGPTWKGLWNKMESIAESPTPILVDEHYITESIREPAKKKVKGFEGTAMAAFDETALKPSRVEDLIEYIKTLK